jgi:hypothetical protein
MCVPHVVFYHNGCIGYARGFTGGVKTGGAAHFYKLVARYIGNPPFYNELGSGLVEVENYRFLARSKGSYQGNGNEYISHGTS